MSLLLTHPALTDLLVDTYFPMLEVRDVVSVMCSCKALKGVCEAHWRKIMLDRFALKAMRSLGGEKASALVSEVKAMTSAVMNAQASEVNAAMYAMWDRLIRELHLPLSFVRDAFAVLPIPMLRQVATQERRTRDEGDIYSVLDFQYADTRLMLLAHMAIDNGEDIRWFMDENCDMICDLWAPRDYDAVARLLRKPGARFRGTFMRIVLNECPRYMRAKAYSELGESALPPVSSGSKRLLFP